MKAMQLSERYRDEAWAMARFEQAEYACLAVNGENGTPYNIPLCIVRIDDALYFHTALAGTAPDLLRKDGRASITCTTYTKRDPQHTTLLFESAMAFGVVTEITQLEQKREIMIGFFGKYLPGDPKTEAYATRASMRAAVWKFDISSISGKENS